MVAQDTLYPLAIMSVSTALVDGLIPFSTETSAQYPALTSEKRLISNSIVEVGVYELARPGGLMSVMG